jgi:hypothetical protein
VLGVASLNIGDIAILERSTGKGKLIREVIFFNQPEVSDWF